MSNADIGDEDVPLRDRVARDPRPAMLWVAGILALLVVELGAFVDMLLLLGGQINPLIDGSATAANWVLSSTTGNLGPILGLLVGELILLVCLVVIAVFVKAVFVPISLVKTLGLEEAVEDSQFSVALVERTIVTLLLLAASLLYLVPPVVAVVDAVASTLVSYVALLADVPTLLSRDVIPNAGHQTPNGGWAGTFLGLSPAVSWGIRVLAIYLYAGLWLAWFWKGYNIFRDHYRQADWTPRDDVVDRFRTHYWGIFGAVTVFLFLVMAIFAPALGPTTVQDNIFNPYADSAEFEYYDADSDTVKTITHGNANDNSTSKGDTNVGIGQYDRYNRYHPFGTMPSGQDMFTFMAEGARVSLFIALVSILISGSIATILALVTSYYKGLADLVTVVAGDSIQSLPLLLVALLLTIVFQNHPISNVYNGGLLLSLVFGFFFWPGLWRAVRGPALQVAEEEWIDAAKSFGQRPTVTMRKHMAPYIAGYLLIYASLSIGGVIILVAALSFLGVGVSPPTPEWGRLVDSGRTYVTTSSWHIATVPGVCITLIVLGFNAFGDGVRDAIDPQSEGGSGDGSAAAAAGGGG